LGPVDVSFGGRDELEVGGECVVGLAGSGTHSEKIQAFESLARDNGHHFHFTEESHPHWRQASL
jgi:hypothetical protein